MRQFTYLCAAVVAILSIANTHISWPIGAEMDDVQATITEGRYGDFEDCCGFIDRSEIVLRSKPLFEGDAYFSRKSQYGLNLQGVCDWNQHFIYLHALGQCASVHNSKTFKILYLAKD